LNYFKQTLLRYVRLMSSQFRRRLSVSVTLVLPTQKVGHVNNIFAPSNSSRNRTFCVKIWQEIPRRSRWSCKL